MEALLLLADGRFPGGGYAHSGGLEGAVVEGAVHDLATLDAFLVGRLHTVGLVEAWFAAAACAACTATTDEPDLSRVLSSLDAECEARIASPALREAGRALGRGLRRAAAVAWPAVASAPAAQQPVVLGVVAHAAGLTPLDAARLALHSCALTAANAAPKLFAIDMTDALALVARAAPAIDALAAEALDHLATDRSPVRSAPLLDERAERHPEREVRLFAS